jgi:hypothetical protein
MVAPETVLYFSFSTADRLQPSPKDARQLYAILRVAADAEMICLNFHGLLFVGRTNRQNSIPREHKSFQRPGLLGSNLTLSRIVATE